MIADIGDIESEVQRLLALDDEVPGDDVGVLEVLGDDGLDRLKERTIGIEIFGRDADYDTGQDAIVRVSVNSVRKRLARYYVRVGEAGEGSGVRIELAPGSYPPEFLIAAGAVARAPLLVLPWSPPGLPREALIAMTDADFTMHKFMTRREVTLSEYTSAR